MLAVLGGLADVERDLIRTRTAEGMGRPPSLTPAQQKEATRRRALRWKNWPIATTAAFPPCAAPPAPKPVYYGGSNRIFGSVRGGTGQNLTSSSLKYLSPIFRAGCA
ncbi:MAG: hypothetical protein WA417_11875 [Stellaceae bacterium]